MNADGSGLRRITDTAGLSAVGGWSADGRRIVFDSSRDHDPDGVSSCGDLFVMDPDGSAVTRLTRAGSEEQEPAFTPCKGACP
jgi:TolB protein